MVLAEREVTPEQKDCTFCGIVDGSTPSIKVVSDDWTVSFLSLEGHPLVIPRRHITKENYEEASNLEELTHVSEMAWKLAPVVERVYRASGVNVVSNIGKSAGQDISHIHIHVLPRLEEDGKLKFGKISEPEKDVKENLARQLRARLLPPEITSAK